MPFMKAPYESTINSTSGHCLHAAAGEVMWVPPVVEPEAVAIGWQRAEEPAEAVEAPEQLSDNVTESQSNDVNEFQADLDQAVIRIITRNEASDFKADGVPKLNSVVAEMSPESKRPTSTQVTKTYERMQENIDLAVE